MIENKKVFILGMARSGISIAKLLSKYHNEIVISDTKEQEESTVKELEALGIQVVIEEQQETLVDERFSILIKNPAIRKDHPAVLKAKRLGIEVMNEMEACFSLIPVSTTIIGITGSNGKTTTTTITYELLKTLARPVYLAGNIGIPLASIVEEIKEDAILVMEISDHQLMDIQNFKTNISVLTNLSEVHTDFHGSYEAYKDAKKRIFNRHTSSDLAILNKENEDVLRLTKDIPSKKYYFSSKEKADIYLEDDKIIWNGEEVIKTSAIQIKGMHNYENCMVAILIAKLFGVTNAAIQNFLGTFKGVEHRIEYVRTLKGRKFYNDSKATNNESTIIALNSFQEDTILIMGGLDRHISFDAIAPSLTHVKCIISYGETKDKISAFASVNHIESIVVDTLEIAVKKAYEMSEEGDVILLSPACASWDQFKDFEERGDTFKNVVNALE